MTGGPILMGCMQEEECVRKVGGLGGVEAFKVRSPRCWPINAHKVSEAWQDPPRLGLSDMSSHLSCKRGNPPDVS
jgi:hypothetical protein